MDRADAELRPFVGLAVVRVRQWCAAVPAEPGRASGMGLVRSYPIRWTCYPGRALVRMQMRRERRSFLSDTTRLKGS
jgi:hypothetical protein